MPTIPIETFSICSLPRDTFGYFGWPTVTRMDDGTLVAACSGYRFAHVCPFGKTVISISKDDGETWTTPRVIRDSPLDDRDAGIISLGGSKLLVSWFTSDVRVYFKEDHPQWDFYKKSLEYMTDDLCEQFRGTWVRTSDDAGVNWSEAIRVNVTAPHGPIRLKSGRLLYLGKEYGMTMEDFLKGDNAVLAEASDDDGKTWQTVGQVPLADKTESGNYHEPHVVELPDGKLIGHIRIQNRKHAVDIEDAGIIPFSIMQTESTDGGKTWTQAKPLGFHGSPPHLLYHSSGKLICTYGYRLEPYGQRVAISEDQGEKWLHDFILRADGADRDLGYPSTVELGDGSLLTVYYQKPSNKTDKCALLCSKWQLP